MAPTAAPLVSRVEQLESFAAVLIQTLDQAFGPGKLALPDAPVSPPPAAA
jgi:hypothetical protein